MREFRNVVVRQAIWASLAVAGAVCANGAAQVTYAPAEVIPTGAGCSSVVAADLTGNGWIDLATANRGTHDISVLINLGEGNFAPAVNYPAGDPEDEPRPRKIIAADMTGNGHIDLITANQNANTVAVFINDGAGNFGEPLHFAVASVPMGLDAGDFTGNGRMDLAVTHRGTSTGPLHILLNQGGIGDEWVGLAFAGSYNVGVDSREVDVGDLNGSGTPDVIAVNRGSRSLTVRLGNGDGTFTFHSSILLGGRPRDAALADFNGNGWLDIAVADYETHEAVIIFNQGDDGSTWIGFAPPVRYNGFGTAPHGIAAVDVLGNGHQDVVMANIQSGGTLSVFINDGTGVFGQLYLFSNGSSTDSAGAVAAADLTGNGLADLATANVNFPGNLSYLRNTSTIPGPPDGPDLNGDGVVDVSDLLILLGAWGPCPRSSDCPADLNGDGVVDVSDLLILLGAWGPVR